MQRFNPGEVWFAGAGPGDPGSLTLHAVNALERVDVLLFHSLPHGNVLKLAPPDTRMEFAANRGRKPSPTQRDVTERLLANQGEQVLRLEGVNPVAFGEMVRLGEALSSFAIDLVTGT